MFPRDPIRRVCHEHVRVNPQLWMIEAVRAPHGRHPVFEDFLWHPPIIPPGNSSLQLYNQRMGRIIIADIDGTVALRTGRTPYEWDRVSEDVGNTPVIEALRSHAENGYEIHFLSGRMECCREDTEQWLREWCPFAAPITLHMRPDGDRRKDAVIKREIYETHYTDENVRFVYDDRDIVVAMWRSLGLACFQVAPGNF